MSGAHRVAAAPSFPKRAATQSRTLGSLLLERGVHDSAIFAVRTTLHPRDRSSDFSSIDDLVRANVIEAYERMQDGRRFGDDQRGLTFVAEPGGLARLIGFRRFTARRKGLVPADIVYDYDAAHLLHSFIARARCPVFYDAVEQDGLRDLYGRLVVRWPAPHMRNIRMANDPGITVLAE